jgi:hypothetical protein
MKQALLLVLAIPALSQQIEFNRDIRPILSDRCFACHGPDAATRKTTLRFDLESAARPAIAPGDPAHSKLYQRISATNSTRMPPTYSHKEPLTPAQIALIRTWIEQGAKWQPFWSFSPPHKPTIPNASLPNWPRNPIDNFILARLDRERLHPSPEAPPEALIRRVSLDITGLPPTPAEVDAFLNDRSAAAYEHVVDRLLASPRYGERMAFRWMEAARYGDTNGYQTDGARDMWRWRDWVIAAFNRNMPYDQFTVEQLAGDLLPNPTRDQLIATGFNRNQRTTGEGGIIPEEYRVEYVADRAQTTSIVWLGLTTGCARCHDHKFDPISQKDFYRLFAYFNQIPNERGFAWNYGNEEPLVKAPLPDQEAKLARMDSEIARTRQSLEAQQPLIEQSQAKWEKTLKNAPDWLPKENLVFHNDPVEQFDGKRVLEFPGDSMDFGYMQPFTFAAWINPDSNDSCILSHSDDYFEGSGHGLYILDGKIRLHLIFRWTDLGIRVESAAPIQLHKLQHVAVTYDGKRRAAGVHIYIDGQPVPVKILFDDNNEPLSKKKTPIRIGAGGGKRFIGSIGSVRVYNAALSAREINVLVEPQSISQIAAISAANRTETQSDKLAFCFLSTAAPENVRALREALAKQQAARDAFYNSIPTVMIMADSPQPRPTFVLKRGAYDAPGEPVTPGVPEVLPQLRPEWPNNRLGLARWIVDPQNPLTARVTVNRLWQSFFGVGIVKTVDDFGSQGEWPVHPELLDWLATQFIESGWDVKALIKTMVMSAAYRQSSVITPELLERDPENRLLARGPRYRLGPEVIRDQALFVSGLLVEKLGGPSVKPHQPAGLWQELAGGKGYVEDTGEGLYRRSLYTYWKRTAPPPFMATFDSPNREQCSVYENRTNSPLQALELMNDITFLEAADKLADRMIREGGTTPAQRLAYGYRLVLAKYPDTQHARILGQALQHSDYKSVASLLLNMDETITKQ